MRIIDADVAKEKLKSHADEFSDVLSRQEKAVLIGGGTACIDKCPTVDAKPVVHGRWIDSVFCNVKQGKYPVVTCSECEMVFCDLISNHHYMYRYCPYCGADMRGGENND